MRIGFDAKRAFNNASGLGNYSRFVLSSLIRRFPENQYALFTPRTDNRFRHFYPASGNISLIEPTGLYRSVPGFWRSFNLNADIKKAGISIYHGLSNELPFGIRSSDVKTVVTIHDLIFLRFPELYTAVDRFIYHRKFAYACAVADKIIAISEQTKADITYFFGTDPTKIEVIYQDCDPGFYQPVPEKTLSEIKQKYALPNNYILCVGTLEPRKNQLNLLKAWLQSMTSADLVFVGKETAYKQSLVKFIEKHHLEKRVRFLPYVPFHELPAIYRLASLFIYPSVFEGFGIPILEALNCGVPVITSTGSCFSEAGGDAAEYVNPNDILALAEKIIEVSTNPQKKQEMISRGLQHAQLFRPEKTVTQLQQLYIKLVY